MTAATDAATPAVAPAEASASVGSPETAEVVEQDLLVEDVSIDGMCGVY